jgi:nucleoid DNA-binding protein
MTTLELINIIAKKADIRESEAKFFFELYIKRLSERMKPGESFKFSDVGYFHLRISKIIEKRSEDNQGISRRDKSYVMLFSTELEQMDDLKNNIIFNIHDIPEDEHDEIDSYFSLSMGKPVLPVDGVTNGRLFQHQSGIELKKTLLSKAEQLVSITEKLEGVLGKEEIILEKSPLSKGKINSLKSEPLTDEPVITGEDTFPSSENKRNGVPSFDGTGNRIKTGRRY